MATAEPHGSPMKPCLWHQADRESIMVHGDVLKTAVTGGGWMSTRNRQTSLLSHSDHSTLIDTSDQLRMQSQRQTWAEISSPAKNLLLFMSSANEMSQTSPSGSSLGGAEGYPVSTLTVVVLLLIPCVVILLLLNCLFLGYKLLILSKRRERVDAEEMLLHSTIPRVRRTSDMAFPSPLQDGRRVYVSVSEPVLPHPVTSSRASSRDRPGLDHRIRLLRPDGATGSGSLRAPSTIRATSPAAGFSPRLDPSSRSRTCSLGRAAWCRSAPILPQYSDSEAETRVNLVPPNSPTVSDQ